MPLCLAIYSYWQIWEKTVDSCDYKQKIEQQRVFFGGDSRAGGLKIFGAWPESAAQFDDGMPSLVLEHFLLGSL